MESAFGKADVTVFTPAYNRAHTIGWLYQSLARQTDLRFEWLIIDDGSEDGTEPMVRRWMQAEGAPFAIRYYRQENGGKHRAVNRGVQLAQGEAFFIVDSDDYIVEDAVRWIHEWWRAVAKDPAFAGVAGLRGTESGQVIGERPLFDGSVDATNMERGTYGLWGDKAEVYKTSVLRRYPFPEFEGENFLTEGAVWDRIAHDGLKLRWFNRIITVCEYREDGLTRQGKELFIRNPKGWGLYLKQTCEFYRLSPSDKMEHYLEYYVNLKGRIDVREIQRNLGMDGGTMGDIERLYRFCIKNTADKIGRKIALYGAGNRGKNIFALYQDSEVEVAYVLDRRKTDLSCVQVDLYEEYPPVDAIVVTPKEGQGEILDFLKERTANRLIGYDEWKKLVRDQEEEVLLTVIIPVYNRAEYVGRCIESVTNQTYQNLEIILVDDGSTDGSGEICDAYAEADARISVIHQENGGLVSARKSGAEKAGGEVAAFVDSDDWIEPDMYECMMAAYMDGRPDMVTSGLVCEYGERKSIWLDGIEAGVYEKDAIRREIFPFLILYDEKRGRQGITASLCNKLLKTSVLRAILDTADTQLRWGEDGAVVYAFAGQADKITVLHDAWYHYLQHTGSMIHVYDSSSFEKILRLKNSLSHAFAYQDAEVRKMMERQIGWYVRGFLGVAIRDVFGDVFEVDMDMISWVFPYEHVPKGSRIILYGAGAVGRSYWKCIQQGEYVELVAWADRRHAELQEAGLPVESLDSAICKEYDYVVIAIREEERAEEIRGFLVEYGIMEDKIIWK